MLYPFPSDFVDMHDIHFLIIVHQPGLDYLLAPAKTFNFSLTPLQCSVYNRIPNFLIMSQVVFYHLKSCKNFNLYE